jgi:Transposase DDE domain
MAPQGIKIENYHYLFKGTSRFKIEQLFWVMSCLWMSQTACLWRCCEQSSLCCESPLSFDQQYQRLIRFFRTGCLDPLLKGLFLIVLQLLSQILSSDSPLPLVIDRCQWECEGKSRRRNVLAIGCLVMGCFVPLVFEDLSAVKSRGCSKAQERLDLLDRLLGWWRQSSLSLPVLHLVGDREFIGDAFLGGLLERQISFVVRLRNERGFTFYTQPQGRKGKKHKKVKVNTLRRYAQRWGKTHVEIVLASGLKLNLVVIKNKQANADEPFIFLLTNYTQQSEIEQVADKYANRWKIECCFKHLKSNGFQLQQNHLQGAHKMTLLWAILTTIFVAAVVQGALMIKQNQNIIRTIKFKEQNGEIKIYPAKSLLKFGLDALKRYVYPFKLPIRIEFILMHFF